MLQWIVTQNETYPDLGVETEVTISRFFHLLSLFFHLLDPIILRLLHIFEVLVLSGLSKQPLKQRKIFSLVKLGSLILFWSGFTQ